MACSYNEERCALELIFYCLRDSYYLLHTDIEFSQNLTEIGDALMNVSSAIQNQFSDIIYERFLDIRRSEQFAACVLPICLKLFSEDLPTHLSTLLACSFIINLVWYIHFNHDCFKFTDAARKSLIVFLKRKCNHIFENSGIRNEFTIFCVMLNASFASAVDDTEKIDVLCPDPDTKACLLQIVDNCCQINERVSMTDEESAIIAAEDVIDYEKENVETPPRVCNWCDQMCEVYVDRALKLYLAITSNRSGESSRLLRAVTRNIPEPES